MGEIKPFEQKVYLSSPFMHEKEKEYIAQAFDSNWITTAGENVKAVEALTADYLSVGHAVAVSTGTDSLHMAVRLAGERLYGRPELGKGALAGHQVFCADLTFAATVNPIVYEGGEPVLIDAEYESWNMDPVALRRAFDLYPDCKIVLLVSLYGTPAKIDEILAICKEHDAILIEDAAESLGASYHGKKLGSFGDYAVISFNGNKIITGSSGGAFLTDDEKAAEKVRKWASQAKESAAWYQHEEIGYNHGMSNLVAGVIRGQFAYLEEHIARKKAIYERYQKGLQDLPIEMNPYCREEMEPNFWLSCMLIHKDALCAQKRTEREASYQKEAGKSCPSEILEKLNALNAEGRPIWKPMHMQPVFKSCPFVTMQERNQEANAEASDPSVGSDLFMRGLCLPTDLHMTEAQQDIIIECIKSCFR